MKLIQISAGLTAAVLVGVLSAKEPFERPPIVFFRDGEIGGYVGHDVRVSLRTAVEKTPEGLKFDGSRSICRFSIPWLYPDRPLSASYVVDLKLDRLPEREGVITGRPGYHNALGILPDGRISFSCFGRDGRTSRRLVSERRLIPGRFHRIAGTMDCSRGNRTEMKLYLDGALERADILPIPPRHYGRELFLGGIEVDRQGNVKLPAPGTVRNFYFYYKGLTASEICALPGAVAKTSWPAMSPVASLDGSGKNAPAFHGAVKREKEGWRFDGASRAEWKPASAPESMTVTARIRVDALPEKDGVIVGRSGFDNVLGIAPDGRFFLSVWNASRTDSVKSFSRTRLVPGRWYRVTGVTEGKGVETVVTLYVDGKKEVQEAIPDRIYPYGKSICAGGLSDGKGGVRGALAGEIADCRVYGIALPAAEIAAMEKAGIH